MASVYERIIQYNTGLLPDMVKLKYDGMAENIFRFYRGTCHLFYEDLAKVVKFPSSPLAWICGDLHLENFGSYKGDNKLVYFDLNDFDEGMLAPAAWELVRLLTSIFIAFDNLDLEAEKAMHMAALFLKTYSATLASGKARSIDPRVAKGIVCTFLTTVAHRKQKDLIKKRTEIVKGKLVLSTTHEKHFKIDKPLRKELGEHIDNWIATSSDGPYNYKVINCVFRFAGTGSVGLKRYLFLLKSSTVKDKYLLLDMKQARKPSSLIYNKAKQPIWATEAERVVAVQQRMQNVLPALLGATVFKNDPYILQQLQPIEDNIDFKMIKDHYRDIYQVIDDMGMLTASAQLRSSGRDGAAIADELIKYGASDKWQDNILQYALQYAGQVKKDYSEYMREYRNGRFTV